LNICCDVMDEAVIEFFDLINKEVKVIMKRDGYLKYGLLVEETPNFIRIRFNNSNSEELINKSEIAVIGLNNK
jgi:hypothetical protein